MDLWHAVLGTLLVVSVIACLGLYLAMRRQRVSFRDEAASTSQQQRELQSRVELLLTEKAELAAQQQSLKNERNQLEQQSQLLLAAFQDSAQETLNKNNDSFLNLANTLMSGHKQDLASSQQTNNVKMEKLLEPLSQSLKELNQAVNTLEKERQGAYKGLSAQVDALQKAQHDWHNQARELSHSLKAPISRGQWGELQLQRIVELAGMVHHCDFVSQKGVAGTSGRSRPDLVISLPENRQIVVDAKAPLSSYFEAHASDDPQVQKQKLAEHATKVKKQVQQLAQKAYWNQFEASPEFVILFLPGEHFYADALRAEPELLELATESRVIIATPTILIALLKTIASSWKQADLAAGAEEISQLGSELYGRLADYCKNLSEMGKGLETATRAYNKNVWNLESRVLVSARRLQELGVNTGKKQILPPTEIREELRTPTKEPIPH